MIFIILWSEMKKTSLAHQILSETIRNHFPKPREASRMIPNRFWDFRFFYDFHHFFIISGHVWGSDPDLDLTEWAETFQKPRLACDLNPFFSKSLDSIGFPVEVSLASQLRGVGKFCSVFGFSSIRANFRHLIFSKSASHHLKWFPEARGSSPNDSWMILRFSIFSWFSSFSSFFWTRSRKASRARLHQMSWNFQETSFQLRLNYWNSQSQ